MTSIVASAGLFAGQPLWNENSLLGTRQRAEGREDSCREWVLMLRVLFLLMLAGNVAALNARDVFVMLSGGVSPFDNNYSQYLQALAVNAYFESNYPRDSVWTFFGAGNVEGEKPLLADVRRKVKRDGLAIDTWVVGAIPRNRPASREVVLRAFREEILPAITNGGTLFLIVGDHGSRPVGEGESAIDLWQLESDADDRNGWRRGRNAKLGVAELRRTFAAGIGKGRVVFCMTQCHSGGFHGLAVPAEVIPNPKWFSRVPEWVKEKSVTAKTFPQVAGFTATDEFSMAAGCVPDPDPDHWAGYERFVPENLFGMDLFTRKIMRPGLRSFAEAHAAATLQDFTIDKPSATSEEFLERWATLLEKRLTTELALTSRVRNALSAYQRTVDGFEPKVSNAGFRERQKQFSQFLEKMSQQNPEVKTLLFTGTRKQLQDATGKTARSSVERDVDPDSSPETNSPPRRARSERGETRRLWREAIAPAWAKAVEAGHITNRLRVPLDFERHLIQLETNSNRSFINGGRPLMEEAYWFAGYGKPESVDPAKAEAVALWTMERRTTITDWAVAHDEEEVRSAGMKISLRRPRDRMQTVPPEGMTYSETLSEETAAERALFYRRVLGAWEFLLTMNERPALTRLAELIELERTPLPAVKR